jgi:hypothetical protein
MQTRTKLDPGQEALLRDVVRRRAPHLATSVAFIGEVPLSETQRDVLIDLLIQELGETGLQPTKELNERGTQVAELISQLGSLGVPVGEGALGELCRRIDLGVAEEQEKIEAARLFAKSKDPRNVHYLLDLLDDEAGQVRYYALQSLILDLQQTDDDMRERCWRFLRDDDDEDVRAMAATCLGHIFRGSRSVEAFSLLEAELCCSEESSYVKAAIFRALYDIVGRPAAEWPGLLDSVRTFSGSEAEWASVASLRDDLISPTKERSS